MGVATIRKRRATQVLLRVGLNHERAAPLDEPRRVLLPFLGFVIAVVLLWNTLVDWSDLAVMLIMYVISGYGVTLGFHRLLTHRSFQTFKSVENTPAISSARSAGAGPGHAAGGRLRQDRRPHTDEVGGFLIWPHGHGGAGCGGAVAALWYAHMGLALRSTVVCSDPAALRIAI